MDRLIEILIEILLKLIYIFLKVIEPFINFFLYFLIEHPQFLVIVFWSLVATFMYMLLLDRIDEHQVVFHITERFQKIRRTYRYTSKKDPKFEIIKQDWIDARYDFVRMYILWWLHCTWATVAVSINVASLYLVYYISIYVDPETLQNPVVYLQVFGDLFCKLYLSPLIKLISWVLIPLIKLMDWMVGKILVFIMIDPLWKDILSELSSHTRKLVVTLVTTGLESLQIFRDIFSSLVYSENMCEDIKNLLKRLYTILFK